MPTTKDHSMSEPALLHKDITFRWAGFMLPIALAFLAAMKADIVPAAYLNLASSSNAVVWSLQMFSISLLPLIFIFLLIDLQIEKRPQLAPYVYAPLWMISPLVAPIHPLMSYSLALGVGSSLFALYRLDAHILISRKAGVPA
ncbi:hypothetical protein [Erythrobacter aureus]|uniref:Uncharacterized protein n=1 Tax=Erythrobacter aureus TaxID=2182384 RepID=A0A345YJC5_9SPHN|nr:hypothetical protein [Erythrobacter aureus]AXK44027.1 hypothetical protein DVR09_16370 [Erythrobacter aureus]